MNILLVEVTVLITIGWATTLYWLTRKWLRQKLAWQWWHQQQALQLHHRAESIRDGLLQQTFAFRRYLENSEEGHYGPDAEAAQRQAAPEAAPEAKPEATPEAKQPSEQTARWLEHFQTFYQSLENLSNELSPPFVADSLPLALQFVLKDWAGSHSAAGSAASSKSSLVPRLEVSGDWHQKSLHKNQIILSIVSELLAALTSQNAQPQSLQLTLSSQSVLHTLAFSLDGSEIQTTRRIANKPELQHLKEIFYSLTAGRLEISREGTLLTGKLCWRDE